MSTRGTPRGVSALVFVSDSRNQNKDKKTSTE